MDILGMTAVSLGVAIKNKEVTVLEAVKAVLAQIHAKEEIYNCYVTVDEEGALAQAKEIQKKLMQVF